MLWSPATARVVFRDDVEIQYHPTIIHYYEEYSPKIIRTSVFKTKGRP